MEPDCLNLLQDTADIVHISPTVEAKTALDANQCIINELCSEIKELRFKSDLPQPILCWELVRLFDLYDKLAIESNRQYEIRCKEVIDSLKLEDIGGKTILQGGTVMHSMVKSQPSTLPPPHHHRDKPRANTDPSISTIQLSIATIEKLPPNERQAAIIKRKEEISAALVQLNHIQNPSQNEISHKQKLMNEMAMLQRIPYQNSATTSDLIFFS